MDLLTGKNHNVSNNISICHFQETNIETLSLTPVVSFGYL